MINFWQKNKRVIVIVLVLLAIITGVILFITNKDQVFGVKIKFESKTDNIEFILTDADNDNISSFKTPFETNLKPGQYYIKTEDEKYSRLPQQVLITQEDVVNISIDFSQDYYNKTLQSDRDIILNYLKQTYPETIKSNFLDISPGVFFEEGKYFATSMGLLGSLDDDPEAEDATITFVGTIYNVIFQKDGDNWKQVTNPEPILSSITYPDIPQYIIRQVNSWRY